MAETIIIRNDSIYARYSTEPILDITKEFYGNVKENCLKINYKGQNWYYGTGLRPAQHPGKNVLSVLGEHLPLTVCGNCQSSNVFVVSLQGCVSFHAGDAYYDYEVVCKDCKHFTAFSYAEN